MVVAWARQKSSAANKVEGGNAIGREMILEQSGVAEARQGGRMDNPSLAGGGLVPSNSESLDLGEACRSERCLPW